MDDASPTVSCVIPVHNGETYLPATLDSLLAQSHPPHEVIVVDDGSTDASADVARACGLPVRVLTRPRGGPAAARRQGVAAARGEFVCFLDADDLFHPAKLGRQLAHFAARPDLEVSLCAYEMFWERGLRDEEARYRSAGRHRGTHSFGTMMARRSVFDTVGPIDPSRVRGDHIEWLARAAEAGAVVGVLDEVLVHRRMHGDSLTHVEPSPDSYVDIVKDILDRRRAAG